MAACTSAALTGLLCRGRSPAVAGAGTPTFPHGRSASCALPSSLQPADSAGLPTSETIMALRSRQSAPVTAEPAGGGLHMCVWVCVCAWCSLCPAWGTVQANTLPVSTCACALQLCNGSALRSLQPIHVGT